ncbi:2-oxoglutarate/malate carrier protein [Loa loa]|uniref:Mitochondrial 2-oxoglutarate/malate carrier protein n=1 Tax=Loa loa TaxID=7209 RepID=A0A1I7VCR1_LOALO|nr:2-oxoglutarate/malate carrier protein [Loa loa]EFO21996.1 2-oxoglutarate/malate carrier protein [Loa loa]
MDSKDKLNPVTIPNIVKFAFGGIAGMGATLLVHPLDLLKNRMQLSGLAGKNRMQLNGLSGKKESRSSLHVLRSIITNEGFFAIYSGLSASLLRQATYTTTRLGIYTWLFEHFTKDGTTSFGTKALIGSTAGAVGSFVGTPAEVTLIRMCADGRLPPEQRRRYKNVLDALLRVIREEGVFTLWRGCGPTVLRAMTVNATQLAIYSQSKEALLSTKFFEEGLTLQFAASMISGFATTVASMPIDIVKTRVQNMRTIDGKPEYSGMWDVWSKVIRNEGFFSLWKGFTPYYFRMGPHTMLTFIILEQLNAAYFKHILGVEQIRSTL